MKKVFSLIVSAFAFLNVSASNVGSIQFAEPGQFSLGLMLGAPAPSPFEFKANMPEIIVDGMVGLTNGFIHTKTFGDNGGIDLGGYMAYCHYTDAWTYAWGYDEYDFKFWELPIAARGGFHFEFVKNLDVYAGFQAGVCIQHFNYGDYDYGSGYTFGYSDSKADAIFGTYIGAKWYFNDSFGVRAEFGGDWIGDFNNISPVAGGVTFRF